MEQFLQLIALIILIVLTTLTFAALFAVEKALFGRLVLSSQRLMEQAPSRCFWVGLVNTVFFTIVILTFIALGDNGLPIFFVPAIFVLGLLLLSISLGLSSLAQIVGERLLPAGSGLRQQLIGGSLLVLACTTPIIGWFVLLPIFIIVSLGSVMLHLLSRLRSPVEPSEKIGDG